MASSDTDGRSVATDSSGNVFVAGFTTGGLDGNTRTGTSNVFITKYDSTGAKLWTRLLGAAAAHMYGGAVAIDSSGNIFVTGAISGGLDGNTLTGLSDLFVTKYDSTGLKIWTRQLGVTSARTYGGAVAIDSSGNIFVTGYTTGGFDGNTLTGTTDVFITKFDTMGAKLWTRQMGVASADTSGDAIATDSSGNIFVAGNTSGGLDGDSLSGNQDFFVTKFDSMGAKLWIRQLGAGASTSTFGNGVVTDSSGNAYVSGFTTGGLGGNTRIGSPDVFVTKYDSSGTRQWTIQDGKSTSGALGRSIAMDSSSHLYIGGTVIGSGGIDGLPQLGVSDAFVSKY